MVFARTREAVRSLQRLLAAHPGLQPPLETYALMGHGGGGAGGMTSKKQHAVLQQFRQPGRRLLVSTAAGEEGIDVPRCELVVRYAATQTGAGCRRGGGRRPARACLCALHAAPAHTRS